MRFSLHTKVVASLILLFVVSFVSMGLVLLQDADQRLAEFKFLQAKSQTRTLAESSVEPLLVRDYPLIENLVKVAVSEQHYAFAAIVSPAGLVFSHSDFDQVGSNISTVDNRQGIIIRDIAYSEREAKEIIYPVVVGEDYIANAHIAYYLDTDASLSDGALIWLIEILIITLVVLTLGSVFITKMFTNDIVHLTREVRQNSTNSRLDIDSKILKRTDEVGELARAFKDLSDQLLYRLEELEFQIRERDSARAANETKSAFLANVSHELRTPLNAIIGYSEIIMEEIIESGSDNNQEDLSKVMSAAKHLNSLIDDMLDLSKIEAGKMDIVPVQVSINELVREITSSVKPLSEKNNNKLVIINKSEHEDIIVDPLRLKQVVLNLMSNACKFTHDGIVELDIASVGDNVMFTVSDTGIGMTEQQLNHVFEAFTQATSETAKKYGGTGLGLTISKRLCEMMEGKLSATSKAGNGSVFTILLPVKRPDIPTDIAV